jgi:hypothetical protein
MRSDLDHGLQQLGLARERVAEAVFVGFLWLCAGLLFVMWLVAWFLRDD